MTKQKLFYSKQFVSVFSDDNDKCPNMTSPSCPIMPEITITINGVKQLLSKLNPYKASGPYLVRTRFLKEFATEISPALTLLFNTSLLQGIIPAEWNEGFINPI